MTKFYLLDSQQLFLRMIEIDPYAPLPGTGVSVAPPETTGDEVARWLGNGWEVLPAYPQPPAPGLDALKAAKNAEINEARLTANFTSLEHQGKQIACDTLSRSDIDATNGYVTLNGNLPPSWLGGWKTVDNTYIAIPDVPAWKALYASMFAAGNANFSHTQALKALLAAAEHAQDYAANGDNGAERGR